MNKSNLLDPIPFNRIFHDSCIHSELVDERFWFSLGTFSSAADKNVDVEESKETQRRTFQLKSGWMFLQRLCFWKACSSGGEVDSWGVVGLSSLAKWRSISLMEHNEVWLQRQSFKKIVFLGTGDSLIDLFILAENLQGVIHRSQYLIRARRKLRKKTLFLGIFQKKKLSIICSFGKKFFC